MSPARLRDLNAWILARKAEGLWVTYCPSCGWYFAQKHKGTAGRPAVVCLKKRCALWHRYRVHHNVQPPEWMRVKWAEVYGDRERTLRNVVATYAAEAA